MKLKKQALREILDPLSDQRGIDTPLDLFASTAEIEARLHTTYQLSSTASEPPYVVIPYKNDILDFFASAATYYQTKLPLSAYMHILPPELIDCFDPQRTCVTPTIIDSNSLALLGASLGETLLSTHNRLDTDSPPVYSSCRRSLSYCLARARVLYPSLPPNTVIDRWRRLRIASGLGFLEPSVSAIEFVYDTLYLSSENAPTVDADLLGALREFIASPNTGESVFEQNLTRLHPPLKNQLAGLNGPFDQRLSFFLDAISQLQQSTQPSSWSSLVAGYLCNRILRGSFLHYRLLGKLVDFFPSALLWYGVFSLVTAGEKVDDICKGAVRKLKRDLSQPFSYSRRPESDFSLDEIEILLRAPLDFSQLNAANQRTVIVTLLPGLDVFSRLGVKDDQPIGKNEKRRLDTHITEEKVLRAADLISQALLVLSPEGDRTTAKPLGSTLGRKTRRK
jgi:hypothetical protein